MECKCNNDDELSESSLYKGVHFAIEFESKHPLKCDHGRNRISERVH